MCQRTAYVFEEKPKRYGIMDKRTQAAFSHPWNIDVAGEGFVELRNHVERVAACLHVNAGLIESGSRECVLRLLMICGRSIWVSSSGNSSINSMACW